MTIEEAKKILTGISYDLGNMSVEYLSEKDGEKMREAIKTLEQEPCDVPDTNVGDLISREDAVSRKALISHIELVVELPQDWENRIVNMSDGEIVDFLYGVLRNGKKFKIEDIKKELQNMKKEYDIRHDYPRADTLGYALLVIDKHIARKE